MSGHRFTMVCRTGEHHIRNDRIMVDSSGKFFLDTVKMATHKFATVDDLLEQISFMCKRPAGFLFKQVCSAVQLARALGTRLLTPHNPDPPHANQR
jgi:hypothetical protein